jgi:hypothetical protein
MAYFEILSMEFSERTEKKHDNNIGVIGPEFEPLIYGMRIVVGRSGVIIAVGARVFSYLNRPERLSKPHSFLFNGNPGSFQWST